MIVHILVNVPEPITATLDADTSRVHVAVGTSHRLSLSIPEAVDLVSEIAVALAEAEGDEVPALTRNNEEVQMAAQIREDM